MNIQDLVYDVLVEEVKNKKLFNFLLKKWFGDNPTPEQIQRAETDLKLFTEKQKSLTPNNPAVYTFLLRHDGTRGLPQFNASKLMDITAYSLEEIESLLHEFRDVTLTTDEDEFSGKLFATPEKVNASKKLWLSDRDVVVSDEGFKVHFVADARESIKYGYYQQNLAESNGGVQWCVTGRNTSDSRGNLWGTYRPKRTFWFVIDESKNLKDNPNRDVNKFYLSALQYCENDKHPLTNQSYTGFKLTSLYNDGDNPKTWEEVIRIYPQLAEHRDKFEYVKYDEAELFDRNLANRLTESTGRNEFAAARRELKKAYIDNGGVISTEKSWKSMDANLRVVYIITTTSRDIHDKFSSYELMSAIKKTGNDMKLLNNHLKSLGSRQDERGNISNQNLADLGVGVIYEHLLQNEFIIARTSIDNPQIKLFKSKKNKKKFGLYHLGKVNWAVFDGVVFEPDYTELETTLYEDDNGKSYLVETYVVGENGPIDNRTLYCVYPVEESNELAGGHFIGAKQWAVLEGTKMHPKNDDEDDDTRRFTDLNPETDVDIKETY
jgi:hypothetical protein